MHIGWLSYPQSALNVLLAVYAILMFATVLVATWQTLSPKRDLREVITRIKTWWIIITVFALALGSAEAWYPAPFLLCAFISFIALKEYLSMMPARRADRAAYLAMYLAIPVQYYLAAKMEHHGLFQMAMIVFLAPVIVFIHVMKQRVEGFTSALGIAFVGMLACVYSPSHIARFFALPEGGNPQGGAIGLVMFLCVLVQANDVAQYVWGKGLSALWGGHKIIPIVSPNKTWEGLLGGVATTSALAILLAPYLTPFNGVGDAWWWLVVGTANVAINFLPGVSYLPMPEVSIGALEFGVLIAFLGFIGDVFVSAIKRDVGVKDASQFLPGHGGMLDRVDSLTLIAPLYFHLVYYFVYMKGGLVCSAVSCG